MTQDNAMLPFAIISYLLLNFFYNIKILLATLSISFLGGTNIQVFTKAIGKSENCI